MIETLFYVLLYLMSGSCMAAYTRFIGFAHKCNLVTGYCEDKYGGHPISVGWIVLNVMLWPLIVTGYFVVNIVGVFVNLIKMKF